MPSIKLTALAVAALPPGNHFDAACPGLIVRVGKRRRTFTYRWRAGGRNPCIVLGHFPAISLSQARQLAREAALRIDSGAAPLVARPHPRSSSALSLGALLDRYEAMRLRDGKRIKTLRKVMMSVRKELAPYAGLPASAFGKADVRAIRDGMLARGAAVQWNRVRSALRVFLQWAVEEDFIEANPVLAVRKAAEHSRTQGAQRRRDPHRLEGVRGVPRRTRRRNILQPRGALHPAHRRCARARPATSAIAT